MKIFTKNETVRFRQVDFAGIVFYPRFLEMLNDLVEDWFEESLGRPFSKIHETNGIPTVDLKIQFRQPARIGDVLKKSLWVKHLGKSSVNCQFEFLHANGEVCLEGEVTLVNVALDEQRGKIAAAAFSDSMKQNIRPYLKTDENGIS